MNEKERSYTLGNQCGYGLADIFGGGAFVVISTFFTVFLTKALGMPTALAGTIPLLGKVWDAVTDPLMGNIADRTKSRFGAKRFYLMIGSVISAITFLILWVPFHTDNLTIQYLFYLLMYILFSTGFTIVMVPYNALLPDMVKDYSERGKFTSVRMVFSALGAIIAGLVPTLMITDNTNPELYFHVAIIFAVLFMVCILGTFLTTWEEQKEIQKVGMRDSFVQSFTVYRSHSFQIFLGIFICGQAAADFVTGMAVYYVDDVLNAYGGGHFTMLMGAMLIAQLLGMFLFRPVMTKMSKTAPIMVGFPVRIFATMAFLLFSYEGAPFMIIMALSFIAGLGTAAASVSIYAILTDLADVDELITSINRPGVCSGMATFVRKIAAGFSSSFIGIFLAAVGYSETLANAGERQSAATQHGIALIYVLVPVTLMLLTMFFASRFPLREAEFNIVKKEISRRKGEISGQATAVERAVCEKVTGFAFDQLWKKENAYSMK